MTISLNTEPFPVNPVSSLPLIAAINDITATVFNPQERMVKIAGLICHTLALTRTELYLLPENLNQSDLLPAAFACSPLTPPTPNFVPSLVTRVAASPKPQITAAEPDQLAVPLLLVDSLIGIMYLQAPAALPMDDHSLDLYRAIAGQIVIAVQTLRFLHTAEDQSERLLLLNEMGQTLSLTFTLDETFKVSAGYITRILPNQYTGINLFNRTKDMLETFVLNELTGAVPSGSYSVNRQTVAAAVVDTQSLLNLPDLTALTEFDDAVSLKNQGFRAMMTAPLIAGRYSIGSITVANYQPNSYTPRHETLLTQTAAFMASTIENKRLIQQTIDALTETETLYEISADLNLAQSYDDILTSLRHYTILGRGAHYASIHYFDHPWNQTQQPVWIDVLTCWSESDNRLLPNRYLLTEFPAFAAMLVAHQATIIEEVANDPRLDDAARHWYGDQLQDKSILFVPLNVGGEWIGFLHAGYQQQTSFLPREIHRLITVAGQASVAIKSLYHLFLAQDQAIKLNNRAHREQILREVTNHIRDTVDVDSVLRVTAQELGQVLGRRAFVYLTPPIDHTG